jgi:hypothetical protein
VSTIQLEISFLLLAAAAMVFRVEHGCAISLVLSLAILALPGRFLRTPAFPSLKSAVRKDRRYISSLRNMTGHAHLFWTDGGRKTSAWLGSIWKIRSPAV